MKGVAGSELTFFFSAAGNLDTKLGQEKGFLG